MTCKVYVLTVLLPCQLVNQVNYKTLTGSTGQQQKGKLKTIKHELFETHNIHTREKLLTIS